MQPLELAVAVGELLDPPRVGHLSELLTSVATYSLDVN
jgi:hypothetical protein